jgi:hypothetical protein
MQTDSRFARERRFFRPWCIRPCERIRRLSGDLTFVSWRIGEPCRYIAIRSSGVVVRYLRDGIKTRVIFIACAGSRQVSDSTSKQEIVNNNGKR